MPMPALQQRLTSYQQWKTRLAGAIAELEHWLEDHRRATPSARERIKAARRVIERDRLTIAFVAERSRGSSELVKALFLSDVGVRLLPSSEGRSTRCPTELLWDHERGEADLRLLPIETRAQETPIASLKTDATQWVCRPLNVQDPEQMAGTLNEVLETKTVSMAEAARLGLPSTGPAPGGQTDAGQVEIPKWRYAIVSLHHPLLEQGLVLLDVSGANALDAEPELTTSILPAVQAVLFVLAADTGVTRSDLQLWQNHLTSVKGTPQHARIVVLNKVDLLLGGRRERAASDAATASQRRDMAEALGIDEDAVFPVSARNGLAAKIRKDDRGLRRSGLPLLEQHLGARVLESKQQDLIEAINGEIAPVLDRNRSRVASHMARVKAKLEELEQQRGQGQEVVDRLLETTRCEQERYLQGVEQFQRSREALVAATGEFRHILEGDAIEARIERAHQDLVHSWTTAGLKRAMKSLFDDLRQVMQTVAIESDRTRKLVRETYQSFRDDFQCDTPIPNVFVTIKYRVEIELLYQEVEVFRRSLAMALSSRGSVIRRFHEQMVSRARVLFDQLRSVFDGWIRETLEPMAEEIQEHKAMMETRLENLQRIGRSDDALDKRIEAIKHLYDGFAQDLTVLRNIHNALQYDPSAEHQAPSRLRLVSARPVTRAVPRG